MSLSAVNEGAAGKSACVNVGIDRTSAVLVLEDGTTFEGFSCGASGASTGEVCFNTSMTGYQEIISDPSYAGQIVVMTYPHIGNYGVNVADMQSSGLVLRGLVVRSMSELPSSFRSEGSLPALLREHGVVAVEGVDTRRLTKHIRDNGAMRGIISTDGESADVLLEKVRTSTSLVGANLVEGVSTKEPLVFDESDTPLTFARTSYPGAPPKFKVLAIDCGIKHGILRGLRHAGCSVELVPWNTSVADILAKNPDGVFVSNGPGDPEPVEATIKTVKELIGKLPIFGICLGNQMIALASGSKIEKLKFGHHGGNQPVMNLRSGCVEITAQNHGFGMVFSSVGEIIPELSGGYTKHEDDLRIWSKRKIAPVVQNPNFGKIQLTHVNLNDGTAEGMAFLDYPVFSVQYHPEASPGPNDSSYLFEAFVRLMEGKSDFLDIDPSANRMYTYRA